MNPPSPPSRPRLSLAALAALGTLATTASSLPSLRAAEIPPRLADQVAHLAGDEGAPHLVFVTGDEEYRSEETMPMLARILHRDHGFSVSVCFALSDGIIDPNRADHIEGLEILAGADLMVMNTRFRKLPEEQLRHIVDFAESGKPMAGFRTATHAFRYGDGHEMDKAWPHRVFALPWISHHGGGNSTDASPAPGQEDHPVLRGVAPFHARSWLYHSQTLLDTATPLLIGRAVEGAEPGGPHFSDPHVVAWTHLYESAAGPARVFFTTLGHPRDFHDESMRKLSLNGILWALGMEERIPAEGSRADFAAPYEPASSGFGDKFKPGLRPATMLAPPSEDPGTETPAAPGESADAWPASGAPSPSARYLRISLPGEKRILTLAEVEVFSDGENLAPSGRATQSSTGHGGVAERAIDGNRDPDWGKGGQTHTDGSGSAEPWWELDLGAPVAIEEIRVWNRSGLHERLEGFTLELLDAARRPVLARRANPAPDGVFALRFEEGEARLALADHQGNALPLPLVLAEVPPGYRDPAPFAFEQGDLVAIVGNGLADRMQHHGWTETLLQARHPELELRFRNLSLSGDRPGHHPRSKGFTPMEEYLRHVGADVVFAFFGYNESYAGAEGLPAYERSLEEMIDRFRGAMPNGESFPRIVLFGPPAREDLGDPNLPDGEAHQRDLALYSAAMQKVAGECGVAFVDLYGPSRQLFAATAENGGDESEAGPFTLNGVHFNERGYRQLAEIVAAALSGSAVADGIPAPSARLDEDNLAALREAVLEKNLQWHRRYRAVDGNDIWGTRSVLSFVDGQTNAEVLVHELKMLDAMTANRDLVVHARARGSDLAVDDSSVPPHVPVVSNVGGGSPSSNADKEGALDYRSGEEVLAGLTVPEGFRVDLFACEARFPELANPVHLQVDGEGRLWASVWPSYPRPEPLRDQRDALLVFTDDNGDGRADRCEVFAEVDNPLAFEFWGGGVVVSTQPHLLFLKDTTGDGRADHREILLMGVGSSDTHHAANNLVLGPSGGLYWQSGIFLQHNHEHPWGPSLESTASGMYRLDPRRHTIAFHAANSPNPHGISFDHWGYHYANDGTSGRPAQVRPQTEGAGAAFAMHQIFEREVRPVSGNAIVSSANFPEAMQGELLICNTIGFLGIKRYRLHRDGGEPEGSGPFRPGEVWGEPLGDLLSSEDRNFRPTHAVFGADGALYVSDWHNAIIGHMQHNIRDPHRDKTHGRIYRLRHETRPLQEPVAIAGAPLEALLENFRHPVLGVRHRTRVELSARPSAEVAAAARRFLETLDPAAPDDAIPLLEVLWLHQQHNLRDRELLETVLASPVEHARIAAATVRHHWDVADPARRVDHSPIEQEEERLEIEVPAHLSEAEGALYRLGAEVYHREAHCVTCHQPNGQGLSPVYPPLAGTRWVLGSEERAIKLTLHGLWGAIEVKGTRYDPAAGVPPMTAFKSLLDDRETAAVLTYVRNSWGNQAPAVKSETVRRVRKETAERQAFYDVGELLGEHPLE